MATDGGAPALGEHAPLINSTTDVPVGAEDAPLLGGGGTADGSKKVRTAGPVASTFNLVNTIVGGGVLALPYGYKNTGLLLGIIFTIIVGLLSSLSAHFLVSGSLLCERLYGQRTRSYKQLVTLTFGKWGGYLVELCILLFLLGATTGYLGIVGGTLSPYIQKWTETDVEKVWYTSTAMVSLVLLLLIMLPLSMLPSMNALRFSSILAVGAIMFLVVAIAVRSVINLHIDSCDFKLFVFERSTFGAISILTFAFTMHLQMFPIWEELANDSQSRITGVITSAIFVCGVIYVIVGSFGYLTFYEFVSSNILSHYQDDTLIEVGIFGYVLMICFSYPLMVFPARVSLDTLVMAVLSIRRTHTVAPLTKNDDPSSTKAGPYPTLRRVLEVLFISTLSYGFFVLVGDDIGLIFGFVGATVGTFVVFILPAIALLYNNVVEARQQQRNPLTKLLRPTACAALTLAIAGLFFTGVGLWSLFDPDDDDDDDMGMMPAPGPSSSSSMFAPSPVPAPSSSSSGANDTAADFLTSWLVPSSSSVERPSWCGPPRNDTGNATAWWW